MNNSLVTPEMRAAIQATPVLHSIGRLHSATGLLTAELPAAIGDICKIESNRSQLIAEVVGFQGSLAQMMPFHTSHGMRAGALVTCLARTLRIPTGDQLLGRVVDGLGNPMDGGEPLHADSPFERSPAPKALQRPRICEPLPTRQRAIDALNTVGVGQRVGIFAGSGVGKSTLLGEIAKGAEADCCVIALVGERGREVRPFLEDCLGPQGLARSVAVVATSDETPLMRVRAAETAIAMAEAFRKQGRRVLLMLDSLTRFATAQREIGLLLGEPPSMRGYTPSVFQQLASLLERLGNDEAGSITALLTVLVDGDELDDPIADAVRSIVDGHIVLDRKLAEAGHYPAIRIASSLSRVFPDVTTPEHQQAARRIRAALAAYASVEDLIRVGAYHPGASAETDAAIRLRPAINRLLQQQPGEYSDWNTTEAAVLKIAEFCPAA